MQRAQMSIIWYISLMCQMSAIWYISLMCQMSAIWYISPFCPTCTSNELHGSFLKTTPFHQRHISTIMTRYKSVRYVLTLNNLQHCTERSEA